MDLPQLTVHQQTTLAAAFDSNNYDGVIVFFTDKKSLINLLPTFQSWFDADAIFGDSVQLVPDSQYRRIIIAPVGSVTNDVDDVRRFKDSAIVAGQRALKAGMVAPLIYIVDRPQVNLHWTFSDISDYQYCVEVALLGLLESSFEPIDVREHADRTNKPLAAFRHVGVLAPCAIEERSVNLVQAIEAGRRVTKDIGSPDPERMSPIQIVKYLETQFGDAKHVKMRVVDDIDVIKNEYPLAHAVTRASLAVPRHHPRFVHFEYTAPDQSKVKENLYFVGKGVTYDTGGADVKCNGHMRDMSRDKCGAAAVAGLFKTIEMLQPEGVNVRGALALVRNSIGADSYVSDEIIYSRNGTRVLIANTDAEGRMVMTDLLCEFKQHAIASNSPAPSFLFTVATLTGHALVAYDGYGIALDNGFARRHRISQRIFDAGHVLGDPFEISTQRREDMAVIQPGRTSEDVIQANDKPSSATSRGHQYPAAFMLTASGLDKHGLDSEKPLGYTHLDIAGSAELTSAKGWSIPQVTGSPVAALAGAFLL